jgi:hypothetical protein
MALMQQEKRLVLRVLGCWKEMVGERGVPLRAAVNPAVFGGDWMSCYLVDVRLGAGGARFEYVGALLDIPGWSPAVGRAVADCPEDTLLHLASAYIGRVLDKRVPISLGGSGRNNGRPILYRSILLPLSRDGETIDAMLGAANCREVDEAGARTGAPPAA